MSIFRRLERLDSVRQFQLGRTLGAILREKRPWKRPGSLAGWRQVSQKERLVVCPGSTPLVFRQRVLSL